MTNYLTRAAEILDDEAQILFEMHTVNGQWSDIGEWEKEAHARHDEYRAIANRLRKGLM